MAEAFEWVADRRRLDDLVDELAEAPVYGLDTEFHRERTYHPHLALLQLAGPSGISLVDPLAVDPAPLARVLDGPGVAVLHAADQDLEVLQRACGTVPSRLFDTQLAAGFLGMSTLSLVALVERVLGRRLVKGDRLTDWTQRPLTVEQQRYAAADVEHLIDLRDRLTADLAARDRLGWAEDECELLRTRARWATPAETAWWRVKEARSLRGPARGVAQEVAAWRERRASAVDRPARFILPDLALAAIAQRPPRRVEDVAAVRGMDGRYLKGAAGQELLEAVARGRDLPESELRLPPTDDVERRVRPAVTLVAAWIGQLASDLDLDPVLLATRADLHAFLRKDPDARLATGWRKQLIGDAVARLVEGRAALAFDGRELVLEDRA